MYQVFDYVDNRSCFVQKRRSSSMYEAMSIKDEPFSPTDDVNVVDDDDVTDDKFKVRRTTTTSATTTCATTTCLLKKQQQQQSSNVNKAAESKLPQLRQTVRLTRVRIFTFNMPDVIYRQSPIFSSVTKSYFQLTLCKY